jgi:hypothetical protein
MKANVAALLEKEVSRKEFLGMSGLAIASIFGFGTAIKLLTGKSIHNHPALGNNNFGYGASAYGGFKK